MTRRTTLALLTALALLPAAASAQMISMKTVPVATGDQFLIYPSQNLAMGGVSIALDDALLDPFVNPAKTARLERPLFFGAPIFHNVTQNNGSARTLPLGGLFRDDAWFGGATVALQELSAPGTSGGCWGWECGGLQATLSDQSSTNLYASGVLGRDLGRGRSVGASVFLSDLNMMEGVELLYPNSSSIDQRGSVTNVRLGLLQDFEDGRTAEAVLLFNRVDMRHDVEYVEWTPSPDDTQSGWQTRLEENLDISNTYGLHTAFTRSYEGGYRIGAVATGNYKTHPKIPNYDLMQIPRDPGSSRAFNFGFGVSRTVDRATIGLDLVYEPIWSDTWADTPTAIETTSGKTIPAGGKTVENVFEFDNAALRAGVKRVGERVDLALGLQVYAIRYDLDQTNNVEETRRFQSESWQEWTGTFGLGVKFEEFHVSYLGRVLSGTGRPGIAQNWGWGVDRAFEANAAADIILAPQGALTLQETRVVTHQIAISVPLFD